MELLEADSAGRHNGSSTPGSPRETVESLQADNARLQHQVNISVLTPPVSPEERLVFMLFLKGFLCMLLLAMSCAHAVFREPPVLVVPRKLSAHVVL